LKSLSKTGGGRARKIQSRETWAAAPSRSHHMYCPTESRQAIEKQALFALKIR
jgi:hypothetical protein